MRAFPRWLGVDGRVMRKVTLQTLAHIKNRASRKHSWRQFRYTFLPVVVSECADACCRGGGDDYRRSSLLNDPRHTDHADSRKNRNIAGAQRANHSTSRHRPHHRETSHSRDRLHNVSRCITRRAAAVDVRRASRGRPQCLDHVRGRRSRKGQGRTGVIQGIGGTHQGFELCGLSSGESGRGGPDDSGTGDRHGGHGTRSVSGIRGRREGRAHHVWGCETQKRRGTKGRGSMASLGARASCLAKLATSRGARPAAERRRQHQGVVVNRATC
jgi:hypothetical protein